MPREEQAPPRAMPSQKWILTSTGPKLVEAVEDPNMPGRLHWKPASPEAARARTEAALVAHVAAYRRAAEEHREGMQKHREARARLEAAEERDASDRTIMMLQRDCIKSSPGALPQLAAFRQQIIECAKHDPDLLRETLASLEAPAFEPHRRGRAPKGAA